MAFTALVARGYARLGRSRAPTQRMLARFGAARAPSLRVLAAATLPAALVMAAVAASLIGTTRTLRTSVHEVVQDARRAGQVQRIESSLLRYHRLANAAVARPDPALTAARDGAQAALSTHLDAAGTLSVTPAQRRELGALREDVAAYLEQRRALESRNQSVATISRQTRPMLDRALDRVDRVQAGYEGQLARSERRAATLASNGAMGGSAVIAVLLLGLLALGVGLSRWVIGPLGAVVRGIDEFRATGRPVRVAEHGTEEIRRVACALNETTTALAEQHKRQLAFVGGVAHDLRSPLSGLRMATELARETAPALLASEQGARFAAAVDKQVERMARMIDDLVDAVRIEAGELSLSLREHDLREAVAGVVEVHAHGSSKHTIALCTPDSPVLVCADPLRMEQVVSNLVSNAIKFSPAGGRIDVELRVVHVDAVITVRDPGVGIAPDELPHIFEPFRRATDVAPGAGLGLSVLHRIVAAHGGRVHVESELGSGSTFRVRLPLSPPSPDAPGAPPRHTAVPRS